MSGNYIPLIKTIFPNAKIVLDRFHIVQHLSRVMSRVRVQIMNQFDRKSHEYRAIKRYWKLLLSLKPSSRINKRLSTPFNYPIPTQNWKRLIISLNSSNEMPLVFGTLKTWKLQKTDLHHSQHQKRKDEIRPFSILAFLQPTTVDKEPEKKTFDHVLTPKS